jgi:ubiquinol-cytochrome c reductase cytochrome c1 subunit
MPRTLFTRARCAGVALALATALAPAADAAEGVALPEQHWSFDGVFGTFDRAQLQRGFQVYKEVCALCHSLSLVAIRDLTDLGYSAEEVKAFAATYTVTDGPNDEGEMFERPGLPSDRFPAPYANEEAARFAFGGAYPPDLSLIGKNRVGGPDYLVALLTGYHEPPADATPVEGKFYNAYFPSRWISMPPPLSEGGVTFADGTPATVEQQATDAAAFFLWAAEPKLEVRKQTGVKVMLFLVVLTGLLYAAKRKIWSALH